MKTLIIKSLLTSLYQREETYPSFPHSGGFAEAKVKRGEGRFFNNDALLTKEFISKSTLLMFPSFPQFLSGNPVFSLIFLDSCFRRNDQL